MDTPEKKRVYVIINPVSGTKSKKSIPQKLLAIDALKYDVHMIMTRYEGHATQIALEAVNDKVDCVIAVGGDGTINEVAKVLVNTDVVFGIIPSGSGNGLARDLYIPMNYDKAIEIIQQGNVKRIDYGVANGNIFFCTCGVGFDAQVSEKALTQTSRGKLMYAKNMVSTFYKFKPEKYKIESADGVFEEEAFLITCANASQYGNNAYIAPQADIQDGKMNISILKPLSVANVPQTAIQMFSRNLGNNSKLIEILTPEATIFREKEGVMHLDGNAIYTGSEIHVKIIHQGLNVLVPREVPKSKLKKDAFITNITRWI
ncbi:diacylglycerol kinase family lipid kinase [Dysgonomonas sp. 216]|uniref:diacylglycerol/lipid kinase family protein n=1 Tax=Dysgonomonas sp. 216 TaxID=2302934 RepID=UPI0013D7605A|nr:diacylglycerol kinase family protein [Dysgonomonas sp. 216]NDW17880.1 diacylglycerol kinase family lipid kinase [Dysgonomonas sp. 216]